MSQELIDQLQTAKNAGVPIVAVSCQDETEVVFAASGVDKAHSVVKGMGEKGEDVDCPVIQWDIVRGALAVNKLGAQIIERWRGESALDASTNPVTMLKMINGIPADDGNNFVVSPVPQNTIVFMVQMHRYVQEPPVAQAISNVRDTFKEDSKMLVMLAPMFQLPSELVGDVILLDEPSVTEQRIMDKAHSLYSSYKDDEDVHYPTEQEFTQIVDATIGLSAFEAETAIAMSMGASGIDFKTLKRNKISFINQTEGLKVYEGGETLASFVGCENVRAFMQRQLRGKRCIVWIEEIEKMTGGSRTDSSGVAQDQMQQLLVHMQNERATGIMAVGPGGTGKSLLAKSLAGETGIPCIQLDLGAMKGSLVGESEAKIRRAMQTINAVSQGKAFWIATCNGVALLPPELRSRFNRGTFFFDLPTSDERQALWTHYRQVYGLVDDESQIDDAGWTGREIAACCENAHEMQETIEFAANYIVPIVKADKDGIATLRAEARGRYISASYPGAYEPKEDVMAMSSLGMKGRSVKMHTAKEGLL